MGLNGPKGPNSAERALATVAMAGFAVATPTMPANEADMSTPLFDHWAPVKASQLARAAQEMEPHRGGQSMRGIRSGDLDEHGMPDRRLPGHDYPEDQQMVDREINPGANGPHSMEIMTGKVALAIQGAQRHSSRRARNTHGHDSRSDRHDGAAVTKKIFLERFAGLPVIEAHEHSGGGKVVRHLRNHSLQGDYDELRWLGVSLVQLSHSGLRFVVPTGFTPDEDELSNMRAVYQWQQRENRRQGDIKRSRNQRPPRPTAMPPEMTRRQKRKARLMRTPIEDAPVDIGKLEPETLPPMNLPDAEQAWRDYFRDQYEADAQAITAEEAEKARAWESEAREARARMRRQAMKAELSVVSSTDGAEEKKDPPEGESLDSLDPARLERLGISFSMAPEDDAEEIAGLFHDTLGVAPDWFGTLGDLREAVSARVHTELDPLPELVDYRRHISLHTYLASTAYTVLRPEVRSMEASFNGYSRSAHFLAPLLLAPYGGVLLDDVADYLRCEFGEDEGAQIYVHGLRGLLGQGIIRVESGAAHLNREFLPTKEIPVFIGRTQRMSVNRWLSRVNDDDRRHNLMTKALDGAELTFAETGVLGHLLGRQGSSCSCQNFERRAIFRSLAVKLRAHFGVECVTFPSPIRCHASPGLMQRIANLTRRMVETAQADTLSSEDLPVPVLYVTMSPPGESIQDRYRRMEEGDIRGLAIASEQLRRSSTEEAFSTHPARRIIERARTATLRKMRNRAVIVRKGEGRKAAAARAEAAAEVTAETPSGRGESYPLDEQTALAVSAVAAAASDPEPRREDLFRVLDDMGRHGGPAHAVEVAERGKWRR